MTERIQLKTESRNDKTNVKQLRKHGKLPAVLYGHGLKNQNLTVDAIEFEKTFKKVGESTIINLVTQDGSVHPVLIHDVQYHYLTNRPTHVDFYEVSMTEKLKASVALEFFGESKAVKELGGVLVRVINEVEVECLPDDLPHSIPVDISPLNTFGDSILVKDLKIPERVKLLTALGEVVAKVQPPRNIEAEFAQPVVEDISKVEGAVEKQPPGEETKPVKEPEESKKE